MVRAFDTSGDGALQEEEFFQLYLFLGALDTAFDQLSKTPGRPVFPGVKHLYMTEGELRAFLMRHLNPTGSFPVALIERIVTNAHFEEVSVAMAGGGGFGGGGGGGGGGFGGGGGVGGGGGWRGIRPPGLPSPPAQQAGGAGAMPFAIAAAAAAARPSAHLVLPFTGLLRVCATVRITQILAGRLSTGDGRHVLTAEQLWGVCLLF